MNKCKAICILVVLVTCFSGGTVVAETQDENRVKAEYLINLARFTRWPDSAFVLKPESIDLCVYQHRQTVENLKSLSGSSVNRRKLDILLIEKGEEITNCHVVYFSKESGSDHKLFFALMEKGKMLSVSDIPGFVSEGGMVEFVKVETKIRFILNVNKGRQLGISFRPELIEIAEQIR